MDRGIKMERKYIKPLAMHRHSFIFDRISKIGIRLNPDWFFQRLNLRRQCFKPLNDVISSVFDSELNNPNEEFDMIVDSCKRLRFYACTHGDKIYISPNTGLEIEHFTRSFC